MSDSWSREEVEATVSVYLSMLTSELKGEPYNKTQHRRKLLQILSNRSEGAVERKNQNISAILIQLDFPYISGYKPLFNYQTLLRETVEQHLALATELQVLAERDAGYVPQLPTIDDILKALPSPPQRSVGPGIVSANTRDPFAAQNKSLKVNYLEREAKNRNLGLAGEEFVIRFEQARLIAVNREKLASRVEHVSRTRGDGMGFDILSFNKNGSERLVEVKTTKYGIYTPFYVSSNELKVSEEQHEIYKLYRVFNFRDYPKLFMIQGNMNFTCQLEPCSYVARVG